MNVNWLIEEETFEENSVIESLITALNNQNVNYKTIKFQPFDNNIDDLKTIYPDHSCVISYGSLEFSKAVQKYTTWIPGAWCNFKNFECTNYYSYYGKYLLNDNYIMLPFGELNRMKEFLFETLSQEGQFFVRPSSGDKIFAGTLISYETFDKDVERLSFYETPLDTIIVAASPRNINKEWRLVIGNKRVIASSQYKDNGLVKLQEGCPQDVKVLAELICKDWEPDIAFTMDMCETKPGDVKLVEINSFSSSGLYVTNKNTIVDRISELALNEYLSFQEQGTVR